MEKMNISFEGKVVLVTGATAGIGYATAKLFGELGAKVAICGSTQAKLDKTVKEFEELGLTVYGQLCDVSSPSDMESFADNTEKILGPVDVWISNAGTNPPTSIIDADVETWDRTFAVNDRSMFLGAKLAFKQMRNKGGVLLMASSFATISPAIGSGVYAASKAVTNSLVKDLAAELAPYNIRVNGYIPGVILTPMTQPARDANAEAMKKALALGEFGDPIDVAWSLAFLASDYARYITGTTLEISGGKLCVQDPSKGWDQAKNRL